MIGRRSARLLALSVLAAMAGGCAVADPGAFVRLQEEVVGLKKEVAAVKAAAPSPAAAPAPAGAGAEASEVAALQRTVADLTADNDRIKSDLLAATTRADETKLQMQKEIAQLSDKANEQAQAIQELKGKLAPLDGIDRRVAALEEKLDKLQAARSAPTPGPAPAAQDWKSPEEMYDYAVGQIKSGEPRRGREILAAFAAKHPGHKLTPNVLYWKGESYYAEKDYENAILAFQDVVDKHPGTDKAPDAMFKQGLSFLSINDRKNARVLFDLVQAKYPKTPAADKARQKLAELK